MLWFHKNKTVLHDDYASDNDAAATDSNASSTSTPEPDILIHGDAAAAAAEYADSSANVANANFSGTDGVAVVDTAPDIATFITDSATFTATADNPPKLLICSVHAVPFLKPPESPQFLVHPHSHCCSPNQSGKKKSMHEDIVSFHFPFAFVA